MLDTLKSTMGRSRSKSIYFGLFIALLFLTILLAGEQSSLFTFTTKNIRGDVFQPPNKVSDEQEPDNRTRHLLEVWREAYILESGSAKLRSVPLAPHLHDCRRLSLKFAKLDQRAENGSRPRWTHWAGMLGINLGDEIPFEDIDDELLYNRSSESPIIPWIVGADEDNLPSTRRIQRDFWVHQHPKDCYDPSHKYILLDFSRDPGWGLGAQMNAMAGMIAVAMNEKRIFVTNYFNRADHDGCKGSGRSHWSCYFTPETSCRERALELAKDKEARENRTITDMSSYPSDTTWSARIPQFWGKPWKHIQPTAQINGELLVHHKEEYRRWWRSQTLRYLTRFPSEYLCSELNKARHEAFGEQAAALVLQTLPADWPQVPVERNDTPIEKLVWSSYKPWVPRPLTSIHVRQGDKAKEMKLFDFKAYMELAKLVRNRFPDVHNVWLSTEMEDVIQEAKNYTGWNFYYTNVTRQTGTTSMQSYETGIGRQASSNNAFINLLMAAECDYFIGALGSTWVLLIDGLRNTNGKVMAGLLSVNNGMFW